MGLTRNAFNVLAALVRDNVRTQRDIADASGLSLGVVNREYRELAGKGLVDEAQVTPAGFTALSPYRVENAVIMAAGLSSRFAPLSYERPKGVLKVRGEVLVERQIRQLKEAGIDDIAVVVGYMKEQFFYLEDAFGVDIVVNEDYATRNNNSTIHKVAGRLGNTYICSSDDYFTENPFEPYVYEAYYAAVYEQGPTSEYCLATKGSERRIVDVQVGGRDAWVMLGHAYWDRAFSQAFTTLLDAEYDQPDTAPKLWEDLYAEHVRQLPMVMRPYDHDAIWEFDSLDDLRAFDPDFIDNVDSHIMDNICAVLGCTRQDIRDIVPIKAGLTNLSFRFDVDGSPYVYRHPGVGTDAIINRESETFSQEAARDLGIDGTYLYEHPQEGWKLSRYLDDCEPFDLRNWDHVERAMEIGRTLHRSGIASAWTFDVHEDTKKMLALLDERRRTSFPDFDQLYDLAERLNDLVKCAPEDMVLCHNDFYEPNFLVQKDRMHLIDWEYSGMSDYASDLAVYICCSDYTYDEALHVLELYFQRPLTAEELFHCIGYLSVVSFHWFVWALYKDACGTPVGEFLYLWYKYTKSYGAKALELHEELQGSATKPAPATDGKACETKCEGTAR